MRNLAKCLDDFEWQKIRLDTMGTLSSAEIEEILRHAAWRKVRALLSKMSSMMDQKTARPCIGSSL